MTCLRGESDVELKTYLANSTRGRFKARLLLQVLCMPAARDLAGFARGREPEPRESQGTLGIRGVRSDGVPSKRAQPFDRLSRGCIRPAGCRRALHLLL